MVVNDTYNLPRMQTLINMWENSRKGESVNIFPDDGHKDPKHVVK